MQNACLSLRQGFGKTENACLRLRQALWQNGNRLPEAKAASGAKLT